MSKHTPGPWSIDASDAILGKCFTGELKYIVDRIRGDNPERKHGNAVLIACAPLNPHDCGDPLCPGFQEWRKYQAAGELLEALRKMANEIDGFLGLAGSLGILGPVGVTNLRVLERRIEEARTVLAKAEGQAEGL